MKKKKPKCHSLFYVLVLVVIFGATQAILSHRVKTVSPQALNTATELVEPLVATVEATSSPKIVVKEVKLLYNKPKVEMEIRAIADELNFKWPDYLVRLAFYESSLNPNAVSKPNKNGTVDRGLFQFNSKMPPITITEECAMSLDCSTRKAIEAINAGKQHHWSADKLAKR